MRERVAERQRESVARREAPARGATASTPAFGTDLLALQRSAGNQAVVGLLQRKGNPTGLPDNLKSGIENLSGISMDDVKVHYDSERPAQLNARAFTDGTDIYVAPGAEQQVAHEAWHVVQQRGGRVQPTMQR